jgi:hypothetical protein
MIWAEEIWRLPFDQMLDRIWALIDNPSSVARAEYPEGPTTEVRLYFFGIWFAATALGVAAWVLLRSVARGYRVRRASDHILCASGERA